MRSSDGHAAVEFALAIAVLMIPAVVAVLSFGPWLERQVTAESAAAEAARSAVLALDLDIGGKSVFTVAGSSGLSADDVRIGWCGAEPSAPAAGTCALGRGAVVEVAVALRVHLFETPWGSVGGLWVTGHHAEPTDLYRSLG